MSRERDMLPLQVVNRICATRKLSGKVTEQRERETDAQVNFPETKQLVSS